MKTKQLLSFGFYFCLMFVVANVQAEEGDSPQAPQDASQQAPQEGQGTDTNNWKNLKSQKQELKSNWDELKDEGKAAREEERQLHQQIEDAMKNGDTETAQKLREQLKSMHQENVQGMKEGKQELQEQRKEFQSDVKMPESSTGRI